MFSISIDLIILGLIAGVILFRLYSILGQKDDDGMNVPNKNINFANIIDISAKVKTEEIVDLAILEKDIAPNFKLVVEEIRKIDPNFSLVKFLDGAKKAFEMILTAFSENDRETLKYLLSESVYKKFASEIDKRIQNNVRLNLTLVALPVIEIKDIQLEKQKVTINVLYNSQQITLLKNDKGEVIEGNSSQIDNVEDIWTFTKELSGKQNWLLVNVNAV